MDLILVTEGLRAQGRVWGADVLDSEEERGPSDRVPLFVELGLDAVEGGIGGAGGVGKADMGERTDGVEGEEYG